MTYFVQEADEKAINVERRKARELRQTEWWKRRLAKGRCYYCGRSYAPADLTMDHLVPLVRGGKTRKGNVVTACKICNNRKKYLLPLEWDEYLKSLSGNDDR
jgi:5-methylcytosine-specific restriction endonuclease McrA